MSINLADLSPEQIETLVADLDEIRHKVRANKQKAVVKALKDSGKFATLKEKWDALKKEVMEHTASEAKVTLMLPVTFSLSYGKTNHGEIGDAVDAGGIVQIDDFSEWQVKGTLEKHESLNKSQHKLLSRAVEEYVDNACDDVYEMMPQKHQDKHDNLEKRLTDFAKEMKKLGIKTKDLK
jgi:hypothetical protein